VTTAMGIITDASNIMVKIKRRHLSPPALGACSVSGSAFGTRWTPFGSGDLTATDLPAQ